MSSVKNRYEYIISIHTYIYSAKIRLINLLLYLSNGVGHYMVGIKAGFYNVP